MSSGQPRRAIQAPGAAADDNEATQRRNTEQSFQHPFPNLDQLTNPQVLLLVQQLAARLANPTGLPWQLTSGPPALRGRRRLTDSGFSGTEGEMEVFCPLRNSIRMAEMQDVPNVFTDQRDLLQELSGDEVLEYFDEQPTAAPRPLIATPTDQWQTSIAGAPTFAVTTGLDELLAQIEDRPGAPSTQPALPPIEEAMSDSSVCQSAGEYSSDSGGPRSEAGVTAGVSVMSQAAQFVRSEAQMAAAVCSESAGSASATPARGGAEWASGPSPSFTSSAPVPAATLKRKANVFEDSDYVPEVVDSGRPKVARPSQTPTDHFQLICGPVRPASASVPTYSTDNPSFGQKHGQYMPPLASYNELLYSTSSAGERTSTPPLHRQPMSTPPFPDSPESLCSSNQLSPPISTGKSAAPAAPTKPPPLAQTSSSEPEHTKVDLDLVHQQYIRGNVDQIVVPLAAAPPGNSLPGSRRLKEVKGKAAGSSSSGCAAAAGTPVLNNLSVTITPQSAQFSSAVPVAIKSQKLFERLRDHEACENRRLLVGFRPKGTNADEIDQAAAFFFKDNLLQTTSPKWHEGLGRFATVSIRCPQHPHETREDIGTFNFRPDKEKTSATSETESNIPSDSASTPRRRAGGNRNNGSSSGNLSRLAQASVRNPHRAHTVYRGNGIWERYPSSSSNASTCSDSDCVECTHNRSPQLAVLYSDVASQAPSLSTASDDRPWEAKAELIHECEAKAQSLMGRTKVAIDYSSPDMVMQAAFITGQLQNYLGSHGFSTAGDSVKGVGAFEDMVFENVLSGSGKKPGTDVEGRGESVMLKFPKQGCMLKKTADRRAATTIIRDKYGAISKDKHVRACDQSQLNNMRSSMQTHETQPGTKWPKEPEQQRKYDKHGNPIGRTPGTDSIADLSQESNSSVYGTSLRNGDPNLVSSMRPKATAKPIGISELGDSRMRGSMLINLIQGLHSVQSEIQSTASSQDSGHELSVQEGGVDLQKASLKQLVMDLFNAFLSLRSQGGFSRVSLGLDHHDEECAIFLKLGEAFCEAASQASSPDEVFALFVCKATVWLADAAKHCCSLFLDSVEGTSKQVMIAEELSVDSSLMTGCGSQLLVPGPDANCNVGLQIQTQSTCSTFSNSNINNMQVAELGSGGFDPQAKARRSAVPVQPRRSANRNLRSQISGAETDSSGSSDDHGNL